MRSTLVTPVRRTMAQQHVKDAERLLRWSRPQAARAALRRAVEAEPHNAVAHGRLGELLSLDRKYAQAAEEYRLALRSNPNNLDFALGLGDSLRLLAETSMHRSQDYAAAIRAYRYARSLRADDVRAAVGLGISLDRIGDHRQAVETLEEVQHMGSSSVEVHNALAAAYDALGDEQAALRQYAMTLKLDADNVLAHNRTAEINLRIGRRGGENSHVALRNARDHLRRSLRIDPAQPRVRELLIQCGPDTMHVAADSEIASSEP